MDHDSIPRKGLGLEEEKPCRAYSTCSAVAAGRYSSLVPAFYMAYRLESFSFLFSRGDEV